VRTAENLRRRPLFVVQRGLENWPLVCPYPVSNAGLLRIYCESFRNNSDQIALIQMHSLYVLGAGRCWDLETSGTGYFNGNIIDGILACQGSDVYWNGNGNGGVGSNETITGNNIRLIGDGAGTGFSCAGTENIEGNTIDFKSFDNPIAWSNTDPNCIFNDVLLFTGGGTYSDNRRNSLHVLDSPGMVFTQGSGVPSGACTNGDLYRNTAATNASTIIYACYSNAWTAINIP
jgi:hypothetical protein